MYDPIPNLNAWREILGLPPIGINGKNLNDQSWLTEPYEHDRDDEA